MLSIKDEPYNWYKEFKNLKYNNREDYSKKLKEKGYDIEEVLKHFLNVITKDLKI